MSKLKFIIGKIQMSLIYFLICDFEFISKASKYAAKITGKNYTNFSMQIFYRFYSEKSKGNVFSENNIYSSFSMSSKISVDSSKIKNIGGTSK